MLACSPTDHPEGFSDECHNVNIRLIITCFHFNNTIKEAGMKLSEGTRIDTFQNCAKNKSTTKHKTVMSENQEDMNLFTKY